MFASNKATIDAASATLLDEIAETIKEPGRRVRLIEIAGHADKRGETKRNLTLADPRRPRSSRRWSDLIGEVPGGMARTTARRRE